MKGCWPPDVSLPLAPMDCLTAFTVVLVALVQSCCSLPCRPHYRGAGLCQGVRASRTVFIPKTDEVNAQCLLIRSLESLRPLPRGNCGCKILTAAMSSGLRRCSVECIHPSQRCVTQRIMTDNIFEIKRLPSPCAPAIRKTPASCSPTSPAPTPTWTTGGSSWCWNGQASQKHCSFSSGECLQIPSHMSSVPARPEGSSR